jgi:hypothetical protein
VKKPSPPCLTVVASVIALSMLDWSMAEKHPPIGFAFGAEEPDAPPSPTEPVHYPVNFAATMTSTASTSHSTHVVRT